MLHTESNNALSFQDARYCASKTSGEVRFNRLREAEVLTSLKSSESIRRRRRNEEEVHLLY